MGRPLRRALGWPTGLRALRHAAAAPTPQEFELRKNSLAHRILYPSLVCAVKLHVTRGPCGRFARVGVQINVEWCFPKSGRQGSAASHLYEKLKPKAKSPYYPLPTAGPHCPLSLPSSFPLESCITNEARGATAFERSLSMCKVPTHMGLAHMVTLGVYFYFLLRP